MKLRHLLPVLLLFLPGLFGCSEETIDFSDVVEKKGLYYKKFTDVPFTGKTSGQIQATYKDGKREGPYFIYREKGQLRKKGTYKDGNRHGLTESYHRNGQLWRQKTFKDGKGHGSHEQYYENGQLWQKGTYKDGEIVSMTCFTETGTTEPCG